MTQQLTRIVHRLRRLAAPGHSAERPDAQLLSRFAGRRNEADFDAIVRRHGPMVWHVCLRALPQRADAEDAFQATFLTLARKAGSIRKPESLASWLYGVAYRVAHRLRATKPKNQPLPGTIPSPLPDPLAQVSAREFFSTVDDELQRLPRHLQDPLILCFLEGCTQDEASRRLGCSLATCKRRLDKARDLLRRRLTRRGIVWSLALLPAAMPAAASALPFELISTTVAAAPQFASGPLGAGSGTLLRGAVLAEGVMQAMLFTRVKLVGAMAIVLAVLGSSVLFAGRGLTHAAEQKSDEQKAGVAAQQPAQRYDPRPLARRAWTITDLVLQKHVKPCSRQDMLVAGVQALQKAAGLKATDDLGGPLSAVANADQFAAILQMIWPAQGKTTDLEEALLRGVAERTKSVLLSPREVQTMDVLASNRYVGTGIQLRRNQQEKVAQLVTPIRGGPAHRAGMRPGDLILKVDDKDTRDVPLATIVDWIGGGHIEGTKVTLVVRQPGEEKTRTIHMIRDVVPFESIIGVRFGKDGWDHRIQKDVPIAYAAVRNLTSSTLHELRQLEARLREAGYRGLVLDFRFTFGSRLHDAALLADALLEGGVMWRLSDGKDKVNELRADRECLFRDWPIAVLVHQLMDPACVAVAAALRDNDRAVLVGEPVSNDDSVRSRIDLPDKQGGLVVLTGRLERAALGQSWPPAPHHVVSLTKEQATKISEYLSKSQYTEVPVDAQTRPDDPQLQRAVQVVRDALPKTAAREPM